MELSTYFRINAANTGQFERTLIIADEGATSATWKAARRRCATRTSCTPPWSSWSRWTTRRSNTRPCRTGIPGDEEGQGRHLQLRDQARRVPWQELEDFLDAGRDRLRHHLEISELHPSGRQLGRRVLLGRAHEQLPAGRYRHQDDPYRQEHEAARSSPRASRPGHGQNTYRGLVKITKARQGARNYTQCDSLLIGDKCGAHTVPVHRGAEPTRTCRARGHHLEDRRGPDLLLPAARACRPKTPFHDRQWLLQGGVQGAADGVRRRSTETARRQPGRQCGIKLKNETYCADRRVAVATQYRNLHMGPKPMLRNQESSRQRRRASRF